jgi:ornithine cyclodeaminase
MQVRFINAADIRRVLTFERCIDLMRHAMSLDSAAARQPIRQTLSSPGLPGSLSIMPGFIANPARLGMKVVSVFADAPHGSHQGFVLIFDTRDGTPLAILDGGEITAIRTAAATAVATDVLARRDVRTLAICGYGEQAASHLRALPLVRRFERILIWGRDFEKAQRFAESQARLVNCCLSAVRSLDEAAAADVICTATAASEPFFHSGLLRPGHHLNVVGSSIPTTSEIDIETVARSRFYVDLNESALALAGDFLRASHAGRVSDDHIVGSIGDVIDGRAAGRTSAADITLFKSLGMISEDLVAADYVMRMAAEQGLGQLVDW